MAKKLKHIATIEAKNEVTKNLPNKSNIYNTIAFEQQLYRVNQDIGKLRQAITIAESVLYPQRYQLYQVYADTMEDAHLTGSILNRKNLTLSREFVFLKPDGEVNEETTKLLQTKWFNDFCSLALDSIMEGYSLIQLGNLTDDGFESVELIPRIYVKPEFSIVTENYTSFTGNNYKENPYKNWVIGVGNDKDLGLLKKASYHTIWKKTALGAWAEYNQIFGVPTRLLETSATDAATMQEADKMMRNWSSKQYLITPKQDKLTLLEANRSDASKVFDELIQRCNSEMSKLILGQTGTMDEKAHVGSTEVHERGQDRFQKADAFFIENIVNKQLKPILIYHGFPVGEDVFKITDNKDVDPVEKFKIDIALISSDKYTIDADYIKETYGTDVTITMPVEPTSPKAIKNALDELYK